MLDELHYALDELPSLLRELSGWQSEHKDQGGPDADRLHRPHRDNRICLHRLYDTPSVAMHAHPWPFAVRILRGSYEMTLATGPNDDDVVSVLRLGPGDTYSMTTPRAWHRIRPLENRVWTVMVNGARWSPSPGLLFSPLPDQEVREMLREFRVLLCGGGAH